MFFADRAEPPLSDSSMPVSLLSVGAPPVSLLSVGAPPVSPLSSETAAIA